MDYQKWQDIDYEEDVDERDKCYRGLFAMKNAADLIFDHGKLNSAEYLHCLDLYSKILKGLSKLKYSPQYVELYSPCQLNSACCHMMLSNWDRCVATCQGLLDMKPSVLTSLQQMRCHYFRSYSYLKKNSGSNDRQRALESSTIIQNMLKTQSEALNCTNINEYNSLHQSVTALFENSSMSTIHPSEGFEMLSAGRFGQARSYFSKALEKCRALNRELENCSSCTDRDVVIADCLEGYALSMCALEYYTEASVAYERAGEILASLLANDTHQELGGTRLHLSDRSRELMLAGASAALRSVQIEAKTTGQTFDYNEQLKRPYEMFHRVALFPKNESDMLLFEKYFVAVAGAGMGHCTAVLRKSAAESHLRTAISQGEVFLCQYPLHNATELKCIFDSRAPRRLLTAQPPVPWSVCIPSVESLCEYPTVTAALFAETCLGGESDSPGFSTVFMLVAQSYCMLLGLLHSTGQWKDAVELADRASTFFESYDDSVILQSPTAQELLLRMSASVLFSKCVCMQLMRCVELDELHSVWEKLHDKASALNKIECYDAAYKLYKWSGNIFKSRSNVKHFVLDDNILHTDNHPGAECAQQAVELYGIAMNSCTKYITQLKYSVKPTSDISQLKALYLGYMDLMQIHLDRGVCAPSRGLAQRYLECSHNVREEFLRLLHLASGDNAVAYPNLLTTDESLHNKFKEIHAHTCFYLAYTYMRSGKIKYAIEEARSAVSVFETLTSEKECDTELCSEFMQTKRMQLRHAWGLVAVVASSMGDCDEARQESQHALSMVRQFDIGPLDDSSSELERLQKVLELNHPPGDTAGEKPVKVANSSHPQNQLEQNRSASPHPNKKATKIAVNRKKRPEMETTESSLDTTQRIDYNLLLAVFILAFVASVLACGVYNLLFSAV